MSDASHSIKRHSKSFYWAGLLLPHDVFKDVQQLYAYCRKMDDAVDELHAPDIVRESLVAHQNGVGEVSHLLRDYQIPLPALYAFLRGLIDDTAPVKHRDISSVLAFGYHVAGTVGIMMCHILGRTDAATLYDAINLGVAMQLVNIARDRAEDLRNERDYIPENYNQSALVRLAEPYFDSGIYGVHKLPIAMRPAIMTAAYLYREIGKEIVAHPEYAMQHRIVVSKPRKLWLTFCALLACMRKPNKAGKHDSALHVAFKEMPCADGGK